ncbi:unnamed protein product [Brassicogethes aeneus]|uniref:CUB domain-containing protein n=1 Tax=Brassicogethes aeneus TaxID=1431903 RepID=A0A9P0B4T8_BRAAE|nr:unnamed protein product [Brassicogethes aeneus]
MLFVRNLMFFIVLSFADSKVLDLYKICNQHYAKRVYLEYGEYGTLTAKMEPTDFQNKVHSAYGSHRKCSVEFITCPSCVIRIKFIYLNISRSCGKATVYDSCGCDYVWIYEPPFEEVSGEQFCGTFVENTTSALNYISQTKSVAVTFVHSNQIGHAFTLDFVSERNRIIYDGHPKFSNMNNVTQIINSPFFPYFYPSDMSVEYVISCVSSDLCRISLVFSDFQLARGSIIEFFDWNGQRMFVTDGDIFRPPVIVSNGPSLTVRFYANGAFDYGFKATYNFLLGNLNDMTFKPDIGCGGNVNNLGGGITMMNMLEEGTKYYDCVWIITPPATSFHLKTHLYVKVIIFSNFAGTTELAIRQGLTSSEPVIESIKQSLFNFATAKEKEHVVPIKQGFYITLKGLFKPESKLAIVYAAFNYKDCYAGSDFLCNNFRCISALLNCDGFDHCGDNSDESISCSENPKDRRHRSKTPNFLFPKTEQYSDVSTATIIFLICGFGLLGIIMALALLLFRINMKARHQRQIQNHLETIHAILEESVVDVEEEIIIPDDPPDYEAPPEYCDTLKTGAIKKKIKRRPVPTIPAGTSSLMTNENLPNTTHTSSKTTPTSPPPPYIGNTSISMTIDQEEGRDFISLPSDNNNVQQPERHSLTPNVDESIFSMYLDHIRSAFSWNNIEVSVRRSFRYYKSENALKREDSLSQNDTNIIKYSSDTELQYLSTDAIDQFWPRVGNVCFKKSLSSDNI